MAGLLQPSCEAAGIGRGTLFRTRTTSNRGLRCDSRTMQGSSGIRMRCPALSPVVSRGRLLMLCSCVRRLADLANHADPINSMDGANSGF
ncbi:hypothetical protein VTJ04DRAFT_9973 [Mycothermus thermophilus]|uniref:uncharacterized protein n=1 Tax=Humicola insolens TaxID=85995 RepID=UPI003741EFEF